MLNPNIARNSDIARQSVSRGFYKEIHVEDPSGACLSTAGKFLYTQPDPNNLHIRKPQEYRDLLNDPHLAVFKSQHDAQIFCRQRRLPMNDCRYITEHRLRQCASDGPRRPRRALNPSDFASHQSQWRRRGMVYPPMAHWFAMRDMRRFQHLQREERDQIAAERRFQGILHHA